MLVAVKGALGQRFLREANRRAYEHALRQHHRDQQERREKRIDAMEADADFIDLASAAITTEQAELFQTELDIYQTATVEALLENEEALEHVNERLEHLLRRAHVLEDGRRVFKTEDGERVFDENGNELDQEVIHPDEIDDSRPRWETITGILDEREALQNERKRLINFQERLDDDQDRLDHGEITQVEFEDLRKELRERAPGTVRERAIGIDFEDKATPSTVLAKVTIADDLNLDAELASMPVPTPSGM